MHGNDEQWGALNMYVAPFDIADELAGLVTVDVPRGIRPS